MGPRETSTLSQRRIRTALVSSKDLLRRAFGWPVVGAGLAAAALFLVIALRLNQPAFDVARSCVTIIAVLLAARVLAWVAISGATFGREERLLAFVMLAAVALGWIGAGERVEDRAFDFRVAQQQADLRQALHDIAVRL